MNTEEIKPPNFIGNNGQVYLARCPKCDKENYAMNVAIGICTFCGFDGNKNKTNG